MADFRHISLDEIVLHFSVLEDPCANVNANVTRSLVGEAVLAVMAMLPGAGRPTAIVKWTVFKEEFLERFGFNQWVSTQARLPPRFDDPATWGLSSLVPEAEDGCVLGRDEAA